MKRLYILIPLLLLFISATTYGQKIRFTDTVNSWKIQYAGGWPFYATYEQMTFDGLVTKNGYTYTNIKTLGLCREDTVVNKVYIIKPGSDTTEKILFDYNLQIGDTFNYHFFKLGHPNEKGVVIQIDSILIAGNYYKQWLLINLAPYVYRTKIAEGIGTLTWSTFEQERRPVCFRRNGIMIPVDYYVTSSTCALDISNITTNNRTITISPNPANQYSKITFPHTIQSGRLTITDVFGKTICNKTIGNKPEIAIGELPASAFYFYQLTDLTQNQSYTGKFIYE